MPTAKQLKRDGPMFCADAACAAFRKREPELSRQLQEAGIIAHYLGHDQLFGEEVWMLGGITPVTRASLNDLLRQ